MAPKVGVKLNAPITQLTWPGIRDMALAAEAVGFDSVWSEDHHFGPRRGGDPWDVWTTLAALAAITRRVRLGPIVASTNFFSPVILARKAAAVQEISGGRLVLGIGAGSLPDEYPMLGLPLDRPVSRFEESFAVMRRLFAGERFTHEGDFWELQDTWLATLPSQPIEWMVGSQGRRMLGITLPHVQGWNVHWTDEGSWNLPDGFARHNEAVTQRCLELGVDPDRIWRSVEVYVALEDAHGLPIDMPDQFKPITGDPTAIAEVLAAFGDAGADLVQVLIDPQTPAAVEQLARAVELLG